MLARWLALLVAVTMPASVDARSAPGGEGFVVDKWTTDDGLPLDHAHNVAFTDDGFTWIATFEGLVRFDGVAFVPMEEAWAAALGTRRIARLATHPRDGALWLIAERRGIARWADGELRVWDTRALGGVPLEWSIGSEGIWLTTTDGVVFLEDAPLRLPWDENRGASAGAAMAADGSLLFSAQGYAVFRVRPGGQPERLGAAHGIDGSRFFKLLSRPGGALIDVGPELRTWDGARFVPTDPRVEVPCSGIGLPYPARVCPFVCHINGPWRVSMDAITHEGREVWPLYSNIGAATVDPRGHLWVSTSEGLLRIRPAALRHLAVDPSAPPNLRAINNVWIDDADRLWARGQGMQWRVLDREAREAGAEGLPLAAVLRFAAELTPGRVWSQNGKRVRVFQFDSDALRLESEAEIAPEMMCTEARLVDGTRVLGGQNGLYTLEDAKLVPLRAGEVGPAEVRALAPLDGGGLAIGTYGHGVWILNLAGDLSRLPSPGALLVDNVRHVQQDGDTLWVSTEDEGLCAVGPVSTAPREVTWRCLRPGGTVRAVHASAVTAHGSFWLSSNVGLWVGRSDAFAAFAHGGPAPEALQLGAEAGMANQEANGAECGTVARDAAGVLWFPTLDGVIGADPARFRFPEAPRVQIGPARSGGRDLAGSPVSIDPDQPLRLAWTAPVPEYGQQVVFRTRLGDGPWSSPGREREMTLAELPPGPFRFEIQAGLAGRWGPSVALAGVRRPRWREGPAPWVLGAALMVAFALVMTRLRTRVLLRRQRELEAEVAHRTAEVRSKADMLVKQSVRIADLEGMRTRAIVNLHHELRTPLTLVMTGIERMSPPVLPQEIVAYDRVRRNAGRMQELMGQLVDIARIEAGEVVLRARRVDLRGQIAAILARFRDFAAERGVALSAPPPEATASVWLDPDLIDKILGNLVHNALKFTPSGGAVTVRLHADEGLVRLEVDDTGPGIPAHARERVFDRLYQVEPADDRPHEGSGIGLAIARELTEICGGAIGNEARPGGGTRFWFTLPRGSSHLLPDEVASEPSAGETAADEAEAVIVGPAEAPLILVVEDHADLRAWYVEELCEGFRVASAADGEVGLARALALRPALVVADVMMPKLDGLALARALRQRPDAPPLLLISAKVSQADRAEALSVADGWLPKPFSSTALRAEIRRVIGAEQAGPKEPASLATIEADQRLIQRLVAAVDARLDDESLTVPELARAVATSERSLYRSLARIAGVSPSRWVREHRLRRAAEMLRRREVRTVAEAALAVGMSRAWFTRTYRAWCGRSPGEDLPPSP